MRKPFPWGVVAVAGVLGLFLLGIIVYAASNQGAGFVTPLKRADATVRGVRLHDGLDRTHVTTTVKYPQSPPDGGSHNAVPQTCQVYTSPIANEHAVHSLEHGAVWITYRPDLPPAQVNALATLVKGNPYRMLSPFPGLKNAISLQAWGRQLFVSSASNSRITKFLDAYTAGPQAPERGSACVGTTATGPLVTTPQVAPSAVASIPASVPTTKK